MQAPDSDSPELAEFRAAVRAWIAEHRPPRPDFTLPQSFLEVETRQQFEYLREWQHRLYDAGWLGFDVPKQYGGQGIDPARQRIVGQELARADAPFLVNLIGLQWAGPTILTFGTEAQKQRLLAPILSADEIWCQGFSEPAFGSDLAGLQTRAVRQPDGSWRVTGHKVWTTLAHVARWMILLARTEPDRPKEPGAPAEPGSGEAAGPAQRGATARAKHEGLSYFLFPMDAPGVTIQPLIKMTREGGFNQVLFDDAPAPADALLGAPGQGWRIAMTTLLFERGASDSQSRDRAEDLRLLDKVIDLAHKVRRDGKPAIEDPLIRDRIAGLWIEAEALRAGGMRSAVPGLCSDFPLALPMMHKLVFSELAQKITRLACDALGPDAVLWMGDPQAPDAAEWPRALMNSYGFTIGGGTSEIQRNILGERVLSLPKSK